MPLLMDIYIFSIFYHCNEAVNNNLVHKTWYFQIRKDWYKATYFVNGAYTDPWTFPGAHTFEH